MPLFSALSARWNSGDIVQILGANGSGKTTFLRLLAGLLRPHSGTVLFDGFAPESYECRSAMLYLGHQTGVELSLSPRENLEWYFALNGDKSGESMSAASVDFGALFDRVGLRGYEDVPCYQLSAGQQRRVALARLFRSNAPLWILDEPFTSIDKRGVGALVERIEEHAKSGGLVLLTSHQAWRDGCKSLDLEAYRGGVRR